MKVKNFFKIFFFIFLIFNSHLIAQTVSNNFANTMNDVFAGIDLNRVPHHLLTDYALEFVDIRSYNGVNTANNYVHKGIYTSAYNTLLMARTNANVQGLIHPNEFENNWNRARVPYTIALSGLYYKYSRIRENAYPDAITVNDNKLYDKFTNGVWQNPYETDVVFMMTAPILKCNYKNMNVVLPSNLWYSNQDAQVQNIEVNFNDGNGFQNVTMGQNIYVNYRDEGTHDWDYKLTLTNGQILYSHSKLIVGNQIAPINNNIYQRLPNEPCTIGSLVNGFDQVEFQGIREFEGSANSATIQIRYASGNPCNNITKPLIVAEGFESGLLGNENPLGENNIRNFILETSNQAGQLSAEINNFDIIYVNWDNGRDDIRRNALLLEDIIEWVNSIKTTPNQNVVLGQSMGGLIARYALADIEQDPNQDHDTRLYVSHDAPHQGANIPISIQFLARHLADEFVSTPVGDMNLPAAGGGSVTINDINNVFNSIGTRQLLANNINGSFNLDNNVFNSFQADLQAKGYPQQTRNIAISNGSHCANDQEIQALEELLYLSGDIEPTILLDIIINYFPLLSWVEGLGYVGLATILDDPAYLAGLLPGRTNLNARFEAKSLPNVGQSANIYRGRIRITKKINFILFTLTYNINVTDRNYNNPSAVQLPLDSYPGGAFNVPFDLSEINNTTNNWLINLNITGRSANSFNFIPTTTALDVGGGSTTLNNNDYKRVYTLANPPTGNRAIPFDNFTSSYNNNGINERHISFNTRNGNWLAKELDDELGNEEVFNCSFICDSGAISGLNILCTSGLYSVLSGADSYTWSIMGGAATITSNGNTATLTRAGSSSGMVTIQVIINGGSCGSSTLTKQVWVGNLISHNIVEINTDLHQHLHMSPSIDCSIAGFRVNFWPLDQQALEYEWQKVTQNVAWNRDYAPDASNQVFLYPTCNRDFAFKVRARNTCGWSPWYELTYQINSCSDACSGQFSGVIGNNFILTPNPVTSGTLTVSVREQAPWFYVENPPSNPGGGQNLNPNPDGNGYLISPIVVNISIFNQMGIMVQSFYNKTLPSQLNIPNLTTGSYIVVFEYLGQTESYNIIVH
jgi:hypothetical protein